MGAFSELNCWRLSLSFLLEKKRTEKIAKSYPTVTSSECGHCLYHTCSKYRDFLKAVTSKHFQKYP
ncbi:hypothetical protein NQ317_019100 [Molorchus minor]|uniref:Uncharacterized protein n=1 Tax=Molorchus minor TaxID=1323400 RepID=A0ABQ9JKC4_9CUCU|nr:hypothetical protein NQ317_019100 [Molorchus minor]